MTETDNAIYFFGKSGLHGYMSNFYSCNFDDEKGNKFNCSEQFLMYYKAILFEPDNDELHAKILGESDPRVIKAYGRKVQYFDGKIWDSRKKIIMLRGLRHKFTKNRDLRKKLIDTKQKKLFEASPYDRIWGIGYDSQTAPGTNPELYGENLLGKCLMEIRKELSNNSG